MNGQPKFVLRIRRSEGKPEVTRQILNGVREVEAAAENIFEADPTVLKVEALAVALDAAGPAAEIWKRTDNPRPLSNPEPVETAK